MVLHTKSYSKPVHFQSARRKSLTAIEVVDKWSSLQPKELEDFDREFDRAITKSRINSALCEAISQCRPQDIIDAIVAKLNSTPANEVLTPRIYTMVIASLQNKEQALAVIDALAKRTEQQEKEQPKPVRGYFPFTSHSDAAANDLRNHAFLDKRHYFPAEFDHNQIFKAIRVLYDIIKHHPLVETKS